MREFPEHTEQAVRLGEASVASLKAAPPAAVTGMHLMGFPVADWLACAMLVYTLVQLGLLLEKRFLLPKGKQNGNSRK